MNFAVSLWHLVQQDRLVRWGACASVVLVWFAVAWADPRFLGAIPLIALGMGLLVRLRDRRGWFEQRDDDVDLL